MQLATSTPITPDLVRGAIDLEVTERGLLPQRLPASSRRQLPDPELAITVAQGSGVRLAVRTAATAIELDVHPTRNAYAGAPTRPPGLYDLHVDGRLVARASASGGTTRVLDLGTDSVDVRPGPNGTVRFADLPAGVKEVEIWLPHTEVTELVALRTDAPVEPLGDRGRRVWLHHGSSISHGMDAESPSTTWPAVAATLAGVELVNLGFGGNAVLDPFTARAMRDTPADVISVKLGINLVNHDLMRLRAFGPAVHGFLDTIRDGHPTTPLLVVSSVICPILEDTPGPSVPDPARLAEGRWGYLAAGDPTDPTRLTLTRIRAALARIVAERAVDDPHLTYLDGLRLYGGADVVTLPMPDDIHPDPATHRLIGERFAGLAFGTGGAFA